MSTVVLLALLAQMSAAPKPPVDVVVMADVSNSVTFGTLPSDRTIVQDAGSALAAALQSGDSARIATLGNAAQLDAPRLHDSAAVRSAADALARQLGGGSPIWDALAASAAALDDSAGRAGIVIVTDGRSTANRIGFEEALDKLQRARVPVFVILLDRMQRPLPDGGARFVKIAAATGGACVFIERPALTSAIAEAVSTLRLGAITATSATNVVVR